MGMYINDDDDCCRSVLLLHLAAFAHSPPAIETTNTGRVILSVVIDFNEQVRLINHYRCYFINWMHLASVYWSRGQLMWEVAGPNVYGMAGSGGVRGIVDTFQLQVHVCNCRMSLIGRGQGIPTSFPPSTYIFLLFGLLSRPVCGMMMLPWRASQPIQHF